MDPESLHSFLTERGYYSYCPPDVDTTILVNVEKRKVRPVNRNEIREFCWRYIENEYKFDSVEERKQVKIEFIRNNSLFSNNNLNLLPKIEIKEIQDTKDMSFLFFNNCILEITSSSITVKKYDEFDGHVFCSDIIDHDFSTLMDNTFQPSGVFNEFLKDISKNDNNTHAEQNYNSILSILGYLLHRYKNPGNAKAIILMDSYINSGSNGGTGKGIICKALDYVRRATFIDGKFFQSSNRFNYANVKYGTRVIVFDDIPEKFDFERIFPLITEKALVERKYENPYEIPFEQSPKIILTTNYAIMDKGESDKRRKVEFVLSNTFNSKFTPETKYGHLLYIEWNTDAWEKFYSIMASSLQLFLKEGIIAPRTNIEERKAIIATSQEFVHFCHDNLDFGVKIGKKEIYDKFYKRYPTHLKVELTSFRNWLKAFADAYGYGFYESHSNGVNHFQLTIE
jgi:hypothetical protein